MRRIFIALPIPVKITAELLPLQIGLDCARFSPPENFHITLRFLGDMQEPDITELDTMLGDLAINGFNLQLSGIDFFGKTEPHSIHAGLISSPELDYLFGKVDKISKSLGYPNDHKKYTPHVTLGYIKKGDNLRDVIDYQRRHSLFKSKIWKTDRFYLYASTIGKGPSQYEILAEYPLL